MSDELHVVTTNPTNNGNVTPLPLPVAPIPESSAVAPWKRLPTESRADFQKFQTWLRAGCPALAQLIDQYGRRPDGSLKSRQWAQAYIDALFRKHQWDVRADARRAHSGAAARGDYQDQQELVEGAFRLVERSLRHYLENDTLVPLGQVGKMLTELVKCKRLLNEDSTDNVMHGAFENASDEELLQIRTLGKRIQARG